MKRTLTLFLMICAMALSAAIPEYDSGKPAQVIYIEKYSQLAVEEMYRSGIPASITLAQGLLESRYGQSELAVKANNHFGIKCHNWNGETIYYDDDRKGECFRKYSSPEESFRDHSDFLRYRDRYKFLFDLEPMDYKGWAHGLKKAGYATDSHYAQKLIRLIEEYELYRYDLSDTPKRHRPESPSELERVRLVDSGKSEVFHFSLSRQIYTVNGVPFVYSVEGETYSSIAAANGLFLKEILRFNDLEEAEYLYPGTMVYLQRKKKEASRGIEKHIVEEQGETMRDIAQRYAVRLDKLCRMNGRSEGYMPKEEEVIFLRK